MRKEILCFFFPWKKQKRKEWRTRELRREACLRLNPTFAPCLLRHHDRGREKIQCRRRPAASSSAASKTQSNSNRVCFALPVFSEQRKVREDRGMRVSDAHYAWNEGVTERRPPNDWLCVRMMSIMHWNGRFRRDNG